MLSVQNGVLKEDMLLLGHAIIKKQITHGVFMRRKKNCVFLRIVNSMMFCTGQGYASGQLH